ncbi:acyltransferase [Chryseobacterium daecheongense]|nr:acyltransferase [Chryseobacterium daecheongense]
MIFPLKSKALLERLFSIFSKELNHHRIFGLDILRCFAIITVIIDHGKFIFPQKIIKIHNYIRFDGVSIFFVLSGFLIGGILIKQLETNKASFKLLLNFWIKRWFRTLPTYFLILSILVVCYNIQDPSFSFNKIKSYYLFCQNLFYPTSEYFPESWSLSVEEWFYLIIPFLIFSLIVLLKLSPKNSIIIIAFFTLSFVSFLRYYYPYMHGTLIKAGDFHHQVVYRLDSMMYGIIGAYINYYYAKYWKMAATKLFVCGLLVFIIHRYIYINNIFPSPIGLYNVVLEYSIISFGTLLLLPFLSNLEKVKYKIANIVTILSLISYSMYLIHMTFVKDMILKSIPWTSFTTNYNIIIPVFYFLYWSLTIVLSAIIFKTFETPMTNLRNKVVSDKQY